MPEPNEEPLCRFRRRSCRQAAQPTRSLRHRLEQSSRLVLTALAKRYLAGHDDYPLPRTWEETARLVNGSPYSARTWASRTVANTVEDVRERLHRRGVRGLLRAEVGEPVGSTLGVNLIRELLKTATLSVQDLELLAEPD